ncbi:hypothetical protein QZH41_017761, partial [Actinostola sp. cb2023]
NKGWWTYELCYGVSVSQYHEEGNTVIGERISLGLYGSQTDWDKQEIELPYSKNSSRRFHSQFFENGTTCDLNGAQRATEVKFKCEVDAKDHVVMVDEPSSCNYVMVVHTEKLCNHPLFKPPANRKPLAITCSPVLSEERYQKYWISVELEKKVKAKAIADRIRNMQALQDQYDDDYDDIPKPKKRNPYRSQLWPWDKPGVESLDETLISGDIDKKSMTVNRMDIIKGRKMLKDGEEDKQDGSVTIMSRRMVQDRKPTEQKPDTIADVVKENKEESQEQTKNQDEAKDEIPDGKAASEAEAGINENEQKPFDKSESDGKDELPQGEPSVQEEVNSKPPFEIFTPSSSSKIIGKVDDEEAKSVGEEVQSSQGETTVGESSEDESTKKEEMKKEKKKTKKTLEDEWKDALVKARTQLRSVVRKQLKGMGVDPDALENRFKDMLGRTTSKPKDMKLKGEQRDAVVKEESKPEAVPTIEGLKAAVDNKLDKLMQSVDQMEKDGKLNKNSKARRVLTNIQKIMQGMDHQNVLLMKKEETIQRELERHFDELKGRFNMEVAMMRRFIEELEDRDSDSGYREDDYLKTIVEKLKNSLHRFDKSNRALTDDMEAVKELNKEVHSKIDDIVSGETDDKKTKSPHFFRLAGKANLLLRRLLQRSAQLDKEMRSMKDISDHIKARREEYADAMEDDPDMRENKRLKQEAEARLSGIVDKLKKMITEANTGEGPGSTDTEPDDLPDMTTDRPSTVDNIKVRITKIKGDDGKAMWTDGKDEDDLAEGSQIEMEDRLKKASKKMERMVKKQLESAGINPGGKVRIKIITSRDALENFGGRKGMEILSEEETSQFKKMILNLMGGSSEAGDEKKRQVNMENNYNLVWSENGMKKAPPPEDDEPDAELVFDDTDVF